MSCWENTRTPYVNLYPFNNVMRTKDEFLVGGIAMWYGDVHGSDNGTRCHGLPLVQNNFTLGAVGTLH